MARVHNMGEDVDVFTVCDEFMRMVEQMQTKWTALCSSAALTMCRNVQNRAQMGSLPNVSGEDAERGCHAQLMCMRHMTTDVHNDLKRFRNRLQATCPCAVRTRAST